MRGTPTHPHNMSTDGDPRIDVTGFTINAHTLRTSFPARKMPRDGCVITGLRAGSKPKQEKSRSMAGKLWELTQPDPYRGTGPRPVLGPPPREAGVRPRARSCGRAPPLAMRRLSNQALHIRSQYSTRAAVVESRKELTKRRSAPRKGGRPKR